MSGNFFQEGNTTLYADRSNRRIPIDAHEGPYKQFLRRYERVAAESAAQGPKGIAEITPDLLKWISDPRSIRVATDRVIKNGGKAGPDGLDCSQLSSNELWELARTLKQCIHDSTYNHGPTQRTRFKKPSGRGYRTVHVENHIDRIVARAVLQIIQPLLDPGFSENCFGFRPGRDRRHALVAALELLGDGRMHWAVADLENAFDNIPVNRLMDIVRKQLPGAGNNLIELIKRVVSTGKKRGIRQGSPMSPLLMNIYLDHLLDGVWRKLSPDEPLIRTADDLLVCCRTQERAHAALDLLNQVLKPTGLKLNPKKSSVHNLQYEEDATDWLGYSISWGKEGPVVRTAEPAWNALVEKLEEAHYKTGSPLRATQTLYGWLDQLGPCYANEDVERVCQRAVLIAENLAFDEVPELDEFQRRWSAAYARWSRLCSQAKPFRGTTGGGSARKVFFSAARDRRSDGASPDAPSLSFELDETVTLYTDGCCDRLTKQGGWAAILMAPSLPEVVQGSGPLKRATNNRAELIAVIKGLERLATPAHIRIVSDSKYVIYGIAEGLPKWKAQGWKAGSGRHKSDLKNTDLWKKLDTLMKPHSINCEWVRGHSGDTLNEECDRLAVVAMKRAAA